MICDRIIGPFLRVVNTIGVHEEFKKKTEKPALLSYNISDCWKSGSEIL